MRPSLRWLAGVVTPALLIFIAPASAVPATSVTEEDSRAHPYAVAVGDLDGDGTPDLVSEGTVAFDAASETPGHTLLRARSGVDGSELWQVAAGAVYALQPLALDTGDGLLVTERDGLRNTRGGGGCPVSGPLVGCMRTEVSAEADNLRLAAYDGSGALRWERAFDYAVLASAGHGNPAAWVTAGAGHVSGASILTGAAADRVAVVHTDGLHGNVGQMGAGEAVTVELIDAATGTTIVSRQHPAIVGELFTDVRPDLSGDAVDDLLVSHAGQVTVLDGADLGPVFTAATDVYPAQIRSVGDVDGDGLDDIGLMGYGYTDYPVRRAAVVTAQGEVWAQRDRYSVVGVGDIDGDDLDDVVFTTLSASGTTPIEAVGAAGTIYERSHDAIATGSTFWYGAQQQGLDADGDGVGDLWFRAGTSDGTGLGFISGATGGVVQLDGFAGPGRFVAGLATAVQLPGMLAEVQNHEGRYHLVGHRAAGAAFTTDLGFTRPPAEGPFPVTPAIEVTRVGHHTAPSALLVNYSVDSATRGAVVLDPAGAVRFSL